MDARTTITEYYDALRAGKPLGPFFAEERGDDDAFLKFGISERLIGSEKIREGLQTQTATTADWAVESQVKTPASRPSQHWRGYSDSKTVAANLSMNRTSFSRPRWTSTPTT